MAKRIVRRRKDFSSTEEKLIFLLNAERAGHKEEIDKLRRESKGKDATIKNLQISLSSERAVASELAKSLNDVRTVLKSTERSYEELRQSFLKLQERLRAKPLIDDE